MPTTARDMVTRQAAIYCRISQDRDNDELGVRRQKKACRDLAAQNGWTVVAVYEDNDLSGFNGKRRPSFEAMADAIRAGEVNALLASEPSRFTRHPRELEDLIDLLEAHNIEVATLTSPVYDLATPHGRAMARIGGTMARLESEQKSKRVSDKMAEIAKAGKFHGGLRPFGYEDDGKTVVPEEAAVIRQMVDRVLEGWGLSKVRDELNEAGITTAQGGTWHTTAVKRLLTGPRLAALRVHQGEVIGAAAWPAIVDQATWAEVQAILSDPARRHKKFSSYLLTGLAFTEDGHRLRGADGYFGGPRKRRLYNAPGVSVDADELDRVVAEWVKQETDERVLPAAEQAEAATAQVAALEEQLKAVAEMHGRGEVSLAEWVAARGPLKERLAVARNEDSKRAKLPTGVKAALGRRGGLRLAWDEMTYDQHKRALTEVLEKVIVHPVGSGFRVPVEKRVTPVFREW